MHIRSILLLSLIIEASCSRQILLFNEKYFEGNLNLPSDLSGITKSYKFSTTTYEISVFNYGVEPHKTYISESGQYKFRNKILTLSPVVKLMCKLGEQKRFYHVKYLGTMK
jgi:hypothetical protein